MNEEKSSTRLLLFILGLRWCLVFLGMLIFSLKLSTQGQGSASIPLQAPSFYLMILIVFEAIPSVLQWKLGSSKVIGSIAVLIDLACGVGLIYYFGSSFFLLATLLPICEGFMVSTGAGIVFAVLDLTPVFGFIASDLVSLFGNNQFTPQLAIRILASESLMAILVFWIFMVAKAGEQEVGKWQSKGTDEKKLLQSEVKKAEVETERLFRELLAAKKEVEELQARSQSSIDVEREEAETQIQQAHRTASDASQKLNEALKELSETQKERENLNFLVETSGEMHKSLQIEETLVTVVETLEKVLRSQTCIIFLLETEKGESKLYAEVAASPYADYFRNYSVKLGEGVVGWVAQEKEPAIIESGSLRTADGHEFTTLLTNEKAAIVAPMLKKDGTPLGVIYMGQQDARAYSWQDVNVLLRFVPHIQNAIATAMEYHEAVSQGIQDPVTGLYNNVYFEERLSEELKRAYRYQLPLSVILLEIDRYADHLAKMEEPVLNAVLTEIGEMLRGYLRDVDVLARVKDGKFAILLVQAERSNAVLIAERIRLAIEMRVFGESAKRKIKLTASEGVVGYPKDAAYRSDLLAKCEAGLKEAIANGGNKTCMAAA